MKWNYHIGLKNGFQSTLNVNATAEPKNGVNNNHWFYQIMESDNESTPNNDFNPYPANAENRVTS